MFKYFKKLALPLIMLGMIVGMGQQAQAQVFSMLDVYDELGRQWGDPFGGIENGHPSGQFTALAAEGLTPATIDDVINMYVFNYCDNNIALCDASSFSAFDADFGFSTLIADGYNFGLARMLLDPDTGDLTVTGADINGRNILDASVNATLSYPTGADPYGALTGAHPNVGFMFFNPDIPDVSEPGIFAGLAASLLLMSAAAYRRRKA